MIELVETNAASIAAAFVRERKRAGSPAMGMVMTLVVVTDEEHAHEAMAVARAATLEHPARVLGVVRGDRRGHGVINAQVDIGEGWSGESATIRLKGEVVPHAESVVLPLLLPDSPVVVWWPQEPPADPAKDPIGALAQRRITDTAAAARGRTTALLAQSRNYSRGNTDLAWTRITPWRALLAAALDQYPVKVTGVSVTGERISPSTDLLVAWLTERLKVPVRRGASKGPGITEVILETAKGEIRISRSDGKLATLEIPGRPPRRVALKRRAIPELMAEELRRLDEDDVYAAVTRRFLRMRKR